MIVSWKIQEELHSHTLRVEARRDLELMRRTALPGGSGVPMITTEPAGGHLQDNIPPAGGGGGDIGQDRGILPALLARLGLHRN